MNHKITSALASALLAAATLATAQTPAAAHPGRSKEDAALIERLQAEVAKVARQRAVEQANLTNFDDLDFNVYSGQQWDQLKKSHDKNIVVHYPDGTTTRGLDSHIEQLKPMFVFAPDTRIKAHPIRIASGEWTAVSGVLEGTFTRPMPIGDGKTIPASGKAFKLGMVTIGHWTRDGLMDEEWLEWDNQAFMKQIGLAP